MNLTPELKPGDHILWDSDNITRSGKIIGIGNDMYEIRSDSEQGSIIYMPYDKVRKIIRPSL